MRFLFSPLAGSHASEKEKAIEKRETEKNRERFLTWLEEESVDFANHLASLSLSLSFSLSLFLSLSLSFSRERNVKSTRKTRREIYSRRQRSIEHSGTPVYLFPWENNVSYRTYAFFACFSLFIGEKQVLFFEFWILIFALTKSKTTRYFYSLPLHSAPPFSFAIFFFCFRIFLSSLF